MHYLLFYEVTPDYPTRRVQFRDEHLRLAWAAVERGELVLGGASDNRASLRRTEGNAWSPRTEKDGAELPLHYRTAGTCGWWFAGSGMRIAVGDPAA